MLGSSTRKRFEAPLWLDGRGCSGRGFSTWKVESCSLRCPYPGFYASEDSTSCLVKLRTRNKSVSSVDSNCCIMNFDNYFNYFCTMNSIITISPTTLLIGILCSCSPSIFRWRCERACFGQFVTWCTFTGQGLQCLRVGAQLCQRSGNSEAGSWPSRIPAVCRGKCDASRCIRGAT